MVSQQTAGITVGKGGTGAVTNGQDSKLDLLPVDVTGSKGMNSGNNGGTDPGYSLDILGFDKIFGAGSEATAPNSRLPNSGASRNNSAGVDGVVIVRVPKQMTSSKILRVAQQENPLISQLLVKQ